MEKYNKYIIRIVGIPGSGKSYLAQKLKKTLDKKIFIYDMNEYYNNAVKSYTDNKIPSPEKLIQITAKLIDQDLKKTNAKIIIILCSDTANDGHNYFIKIDDIENVYRRFIENEYKKINTNKELVNGIIKNLKNPNDIKRAIDENIIQSPRYNFTQYKNLYKRAFENYKGRKFLIGTQDQIYNDIISFYNMFLCYRD